MRRIAIIAGLLLVMTVGPACDNPTTIVDTTTPPALTSSTLAVLPPDLATAGLDASPAVAEGTISADEAARRVAEETGGRYAAGSTDAYLVSLTDDGTSRSDRPIHDRLVWLFRYSDLSIPYTGPVTADGTPAEGGVVTHAYVVIDAFTGDWLYTTETG
jgi:hypothetical protein